MFRPQQFRNRKGRKGGCRSYRHAYTMAGIEFKQEFFMTHREMRRYWEERKAALYGPLRLMSRWLSMKGVNTIKKAQDCLKTS